MDTPAQRMGYLTGAYLAGWVTVTILVWTDAPVWLAVLVLLAAVLALAYLADAGPSPGVHRHIRMHSRTRCAGKPCAVHSPTAHHMRGWPLAWVHMPAVALRLCPHGVRHPDPDEDARVGLSGLLIANRHPGCDGCCDPRPAEGE
jgi:hypothetical protein